MSKKPTTPTNPEQLPETPTSPFQQLGSLRILRGCILLLCVKSRGVEAILSTGLSLTIPYREIQKLGFRNNRQFADALEMGTDFPTLWFTTQSMTNPRPTWADSWGDGSGSTRPSTPRPAPAPRAEHVEADPQDEPQPEEQAQGQVLLPLPKSLPPHRGGGVAFGGR